MHHPEYSSVDPNNGNINYRGYLSIEKGDHSHMPSRTEAYLPGDERGHVNASSLNGGNSPDNVAPQHYDVNHGEYRAVEQAETTALQNGATIYSEKTAYVNGKPGDRPTAYLVVDTVTFADGHTETISHSFTNEPHALQETWNEMSLDDTCPGGNPTDVLSPADAKIYVEVMEQNTSLPSIQDDYAPSGHYISLPGAETDGASARADTARAEAGGDAVGASADDNSGPSADPDAD